MGFVLHLQHLWSEKRGAVTGNTNTDYRPKEMRCGGGMSSKQLFLALQTESTAYVVFIMFPLWQRGIPPLICTSNEACFSQYQLRAFPQASLLAVHAEAPAPAAAATVTPVRLTLALLDFSQVRGTVTTNLSELFQTAQLIQTETGLIWTETDTSSMWQAQEEWPLWTAWAQPEGTVSPNSPAPDVVAGRSRSRATALRAVASPTHSTSGSSTTDQNFPPKHCPHIFSMEIGVRRFSEKGKEGEKIGENMKMSSHF